MDHAGQAKKDGGTVPTEGKQPQPPQKKPKGNNGVGKRVNGSFWMDDLWIVELPGK